jgi:hypothetical protein
MAELRNIYTAWQKNQGADAMTWAELDAAYRTGQLKAVRVPDSKKEMLKRLEVQFENWLNP